MAKLLVLVGAGQNANANSNSNSDGGQFMYSLKDRRRLSGWDLHIVDSNQYYPGAPVNSKENEQVEMLVKKYIDRGFIRDRHYQLSFQDYIKAHLDQIKIEYSEIVFLSYTVMPIETIIYINKKLEYPALSFGHSSGKISVDILWSGLRDLDMMKRQKDKIGVANRIIQTAKEMFDFQESDIDMYNRLVEDLLDIEAIGCDNLNLLVRECLLNASLQLKIMASGNLHYRRDSNGKVFGDSGRIPHEFCGEKDRFYSYIRREDIPIQHSGGAYDEWESRQIKRARRPIMATKYHLSRKLVDMFELSLPFANFDEYYDGTGRDLNDKELCTVFANYFSKFN